MEIGLGRFLEVALYSLVNLIPYLCIALFAFSGMLRFRFWGTALLVGLLCVIQVGFGLCATTLFPSAVGGISALNILVYLGFFLSVAHASFGRIAFVLLSLCNFGNMIVYCSKYVETLLFPEMSLLSYHWSYSVSMLLVQAVFVVPMLYAIRQWVRPVIVLAGTNSLWKYVWLIPLTFYITWFYATYCIALKGQQADAARELGTALYMLSLNAAYLLVYYIVLRMVQETSRSEKLKEQNHILQMQNVQYEHLEEQIEEARRARHDLRQHYSILSSYLDKGMYEELRKYIEECRAEWTPDGTMVYCSNPAVNAVVMYYCDQARRAYVETEVQVDLPESLPVQESDLAVLFGNLLENALEACKRQPDRSRFIHLRVSLCGDMMVLTMENSYSGEIQKTARGFISQKSSHEGIGVVSIRAIVQKYAGTVRFENNDGVFQASVALRLNLERERCSLTPAR